MLTTHSGHSGVISDRIRSRPGIVRKALCLWFPMDWATDQVRAMIPEGTDSSVYSYVRRRRGVDEYASAVVLPIEGSGLACPSQSSGGWEVYSCVQKKDITLPVRSTLPSPGEVEIVCLAHRYQLTLEELEARLRLDLRAVRLKSLPERVLDLIYKKHEDFCDAYRENPVEGRVPGMVEPTMITWERGKDPKRPVYHHYLPNGETFVRIFPALTFDHVDYSSSLVQWPYRNRVRPFGDSPTPGTTHQCRILWTMTAQGCPVGHAHIVK